MELTVNPIPQMPPITFNYDELKAQIAERTNEYKTLVYTAEQIDLAKKDRSHLNALKKALSDERIRRKKEYLEPFETFESQVKELCTLIDEPVQLIDKQIKEYEEKEKAEKREKCVEIFNTIEHPAWLKYEQIENVKWYNKTTSLASITKEIETIIESVNSSMFALSQMPEFAFEAIEEFKRTLDMQSAINEGRRLRDIQKRKEEAEKIPFLATPEEVTEIKPDEDEDEEPKRFWVKFEAFLSYEEAMELKTYFKFSHITYRQIEGGE